MKTNFNNDYDVLKTELNSITDFFETDDGQDRFGEPWIGKENFNKLLGIKEDVENGDLPDKATMKKVYWIYKNLLKYLEAEKSDEELGIDFIMNEDKYKNTIDIVEKKSQELMSEMEHRKENIKVFADDIK